MLNPLLAASDGIGVGEIIFILVYLFILVVMIAGCWKMFEKANQPGWGIFIPFYNMILMLRIAGKPTWWLILMFVPLVSIIVWVLVTSSTAKNFGKGGGFTVGLIFLPMIFYPILGFGSAEYNPGGLPTIGISDQTA
jgi:hypothetical protein